MDCVMPECGQATSGARPGRPPKPRCNTQCVRTGLGGEEPLPAHGSDDAVVIVDCQGRICEWNPGAEKLFGHPADSVIGRNFFQLIAPHCAALATDGTACHRRLCRTPGRAIVLFARHRSGDDIPIEMQTFSGCTKEAGGALLVVRDAAGHGRPIRDRTTSAQGG